MTIILSYKYRVLLGNNTAKTAIYSMWLVMTLVQKYIKEEDKENKKKKYPQLLYTFTTLQLLTLTLVNYEGGEGKMDIKITNLNLAVPSQELLLVSTYKNPINLNIYCSCKIQYPNTVILQLFTTSSCIWNAVLLSTMFLYFTLISYLSNLELHLLFG